jgi:hypothetical protein
MEAGKYSQGQVTRALGTSKHSRVFSQVSPSGLTVINKSLSFSRPCSPYLSKEEAGNLRDCFSFNVLGLQASTRRGNRTEAAKR